MLITRIFNNMMIRTKLWFGFSIMFVVLAALATNVLISFSATHDNVDNIVNTIQPPLIDSMALANQIDSASESLGFYLLSKEESHKQNYLDTLEQIGATMQTLEQRPLIQSHAELRGQFEKLQIQVLRFAAYREQMLKLADSRDTNIPAFAYSAEKINPLSRQTLQLLSMMQLSEADEEATDERRELLVIISNLRYAWVNAIMEIRSYLAFRTKATEQNIYNYVESTAAELEKVKELEELLTFEQADALEQFEALSAELVSNLKGLIELHSSEKWRTDAYLIRHAIGPLAASIKGDLDQLVERLQQTTNEDSDSLIAQIEQGRTVTITLLIIGLTLGTLGAVIVSKVITEPILGAVKNMNEIAGGGGNLACSMSLKTKDELGQLCSAFNNFLGTIRDIVSPVMGSTERLSSSAEKMSQVTAQTSEGITRQRMETEQVATAMNQMTSTAHEMVNHAQSAATAASEADEEALKGRKIVEHSINDINQLASAVQNAAEVIHQLEQDSQNIGSVLDVIRGIAEQTNLLALNAAIEAARAGEQGRGFAVVADEVRTLASRTQSSTQEIQEMIERLQRGANDAVSVMEEGREQAQSSVEQASRAGESLASITRVVARITEMNNHILSAAQQQGHVAEEINSNITSITQVAEQTAAGTRELDEASSELAQLADELKSLVGHFQT